MSSSLLLDELLRDTCTEGSNSKYTHEVYIGNKFRWNLRPEKYEQFFSRYSEIISDLSDTNYGIGERSGSTSPFIVEILLKFHSDGGNGEYYEDDFLHSTLYNIQEVMAQNLKIGKREREFYCIILESPKPVYDEDTDIYSICVRFHFPYCRLYKKISKNLLTKVAVTLHNENVVSKLFYQPTDSWKDSINMSYMDSTVLMYGGIYNENSPKMEYYKCFEKLNSSDSDDSEDSHELSIIDSFNANDHSYVNSGQISEEAFSSGYYEEYWLPVILSLHFGHIITLHKERTRDMGANYESPKHRIKGFGMGIDRKEINVMDMCHKFLYMWKPDNVLRKHNCMCIGEAYYDAARGLDTGMKAWIDIINKSIKEVGSMPDYMKPSVIDFTDTYYDTFKKEKTTVKTLAWQARLDSPKLYREWHQVWCTKSLEKATHITHTDIAKAFYRTYWLEFMCTFRGNSTIWYVFKDNTLAENPRGNIIRSIISDEFADKVEDMRLDILKEVRQSDNETDKREGEEIAAKIGILLHKLKTSPFKSSIMRELEECYSCDSLDKHLDQDHELLGLPNGVIVATTQDIYFRAGRPEDYITMCTGTAYKDRIHWEHPKVKEFTTWMDMMFLDEELKLYMYKYLASILRGCNSDKKLPIWTGEGDNSKTMLVHALECTLGAYCVKISISLLTNPRADANNASPATMSISGTRVFIFEEGEDGQKLGGGISKMYSGNDTLATRPLYGTSRKIKNTSKPIIVLNNVPEFNGGGKAIVNRVCNIPFLSTWCDNPPRTEEERYKKGLFQLDKFFADKIPGMAAAILWVLVQYYPVYLKEGARKIPKIADEETKRYWEQKDTYYRFSRDSIVTVRLKNGEPDMDVKLETYEAYNCFKSWYRTTMPAAKIPDISTFETQIKTRWGKPVDGCWSGIKVRETEEEDNREDRTRKRRFKRADDI